MIIDLTEAVRFLLTEHTYPNAQKITEKEFATSNSDSAPTLV